jgi:Beta-glucan synthesis-associated protein SKN1/KRE6/Sbg1
LIATMPMISSFSGWVDPDSPAEFRTMASYTDGKIYDLIMSDEFNREGRSFKDGDDPTWTGMKRLHLHADAFYIEFHRCFQFRRSGE